MRYFLLILLFLPLSVIAGGLRWGLAGEAGFISVDDPDGGNSGYYIGTAVSSSFDLRARGQRISSGLGYLGSSMDASESMVGQNISGYYLYSRWERRTPIFRKYAETFFFVGGKLLQTTHTERHTRESGYLKERYEDREVTGVNLTIGASYEFTHRGKRTSLPTVFVDIPVSGGTWIFGTTYQFYF